MCDYMTELSLRHSCLDFIHEKYPHSGPKAVMAFRLNSLVLEGGFMLNSCGETEIESFKSS